MARVLTASGYFYRLDPKQWRDGRPYPPLGTLQLAAVLREAGHEVEVFDTGLRHGPDEIREALDRWKPDILILQDYLTQQQGDPNS